MKVRHFAASDAACRPLSRAAVKATWRFVR
jgi:hypothetical protein